MKKVARIKRNSTAHSAFTHRSKVVKNSFFIQKNNLFRHPQRRKKKKQQRMKEEVEENPHHNVEKLSVELEGRRVKIGWYEANKKHNSQERERESCLIKCLRAKRVSKWVKESAASLRWQFSSLFHEIAKIFHHHTRKGKERKRKKLYKEKASSSSTFLTAGNEIMLFVPFLCIFA